MEGRIGGNVAFRGVYLHCSVSRRYLTRISWNVADFSFTIGPQVTANL